MFYFVLLEKNVLPFSFSHSLTSTLESLSYYIRWRGATWALVARQHFVTRRACKSCRKLTVPISRCTSSLYTVKYESEKEQDGERKRERPQPFSQHRYIIRYEYFYTSIYRYIFKYCTKLLNGELRCREFVKWVRYSCVVRLSPY